MSTSVPRLVRDVLRTPGGPLDPAMRAFMESRFGHGFGNVRVHTDAAAAESAVSIGARAYTAGRHVVFGAGQYRPESGPGRWLIAHELVHVIQQRGEDASGPLVLGHSGSALERAAGRVADRVLAGLPPGLSAAGPWAPPGLVQRHPGPPCPPWDRADASGVEIWGPANKVLEDVYQFDHGGHSILYGSQFENRDIRLPIGAPNKKFGDALLDELRGISRQLRPDIIDFTDRHFYEIKTTNYARAGQVQLAGYYKVAAAICRKYGEPEWSDLMVSWYPPHALPFPSDPLNKCVCTQSTDYGLFAPPRGVVLYEVLRRPDDEEEKKSQAAAQKMTLVLTPEFRDMAPRLEAEAARAVGGPPGSVYLITAPPEFITAWQNEMRMQRTENLLQVKPPPFLDLRNPVGQFRALGWVLIGLTAGAFAACYLCVAASALIGGGAAVGGAAATGGGAAGGGAEVISLAAYRAMLASPAAKAAAMAAGVLVVAGNISDSRAANPAVSSVSVLRAIRVPAYNNFAALFPIGKQVSYRGSAAVVIGHLQVQ